MPTERTASRRLTRASIKRRRKQAHFVNAAFLRRLTEQAARELFLAPAKGSA